MAILYLSFIIFPFKNKITVKNSFQNNIKNDRKRLSYNEFSDEFDKNVNRLDGKKMNILTDIRIRSE